MREYDVHLFCNECNQPHPIGVRIASGELPDSDGRLNDLYAGEELPAALVTMRGNSTRCPKTGATITQRTNADVFLVRVQ